MLNIVECEWNPNLISLEANMQSLLPLDGDYSWDDKFEDGLIASVDLFTHRAVARIMLGYKAVETVVGYDDDSDADDMEVTLTGADFDIEVDYRDNGYYGASLNVELTYNGDLNLYVSEEYNITLNALRYLVERLDTDTLNEVFSDAFDQNSYLLTYEDYEEDEEEFA